VKDRRPGVTAAIHAARAFDRLYSGDLGGYLHHTVQAVVRFEQAGDQRVATLYRINVAYALIEVGAYERAKETLEQAMTTATRMGLARLIALGQNNLGVVHLHLGQLDEARRVQTQAVEAYVRSGNKRMEGGSRRNLAAVLTEMGDLDAAEQQARAAIGVLEGAPPLRAHALATLARIALQRGDQPRARKLIDRARAIADDMGDIEEGEALIRLVFAQVLRAEGDIEGARGAIAHARERLLARAEWLIEPDQRESFLERVPDNAETFALYASLAIRSRA
jgi:tetratricopeptide (TPR) repeat protein